MHLRNVACVRSSARQLHLCMRVRRASYPLEWHRSASSTHPFTWLSAWRAQSAFIVCSARLLCLLVYSTIVARRFQKLRRTVEQVNVNTVVLGASITGTITPCKICVADIKEHDVLLHADRL